MLRGTYVWILRLHPQRFRRRFAEEMLFIFDEVASGPSEARQTKAKLVGDGIVSLLRQWALRSEFRREPAVAVPAPSTPEGVPAFYTFGSFKPRPTAMIHGAILSLAVLCTALLAVRYSWNHTVDLRLPPVDREGDTSSPERESAIIPFAVPSAPYQTRSPGQNAKEVGRLYGTEGSPFPEKSQRQRVGPLRAQAAASAERRFELFQPQDRQPKPHNSNSAMLVETVEDGKLDAGERQRVIDGAIANLNEYYVYPDVAQKMAEALLAHEKSGDDDAGTDGRAFADLLTTQMRDVSHDRHLMVVYNRAQTSERTPGPTPEDLARYREDMRRSNCTFEKIKVLRRNIGYLKFNEFPDPTVCRPTAVAAMNLLGHADAIIFDLRDNHGGDPRMVALISTYLFDRPTHLNDIYNRRDNATQQYWTLPPVPGNKLVDKPAYVLTSASTFSGAEEFCYDLKMLKRATLVGETTAGGAHMVSRHRIDAHFIIAVPEARPINPISKTDWEGKGVEPDVKVRAALALATAEKLAESNLPEK